MLRDFALAKAGKNNDNAGDSEIGPPANENEPLEMILGFLLSLVFAASALAATFESWQAAHFTAVELANPAISGEDASPAGDGLSNLLK